MMSTVTLYKQGKMRQVDPRRDLFEIADLVESSFQLDSDPEGRYVMRQIRSTAQKQQKEAERLGHSFFPGAPQGFVWEQDGRVMGNVSILPFGSLWKRIVLLANVAVAEELRGRGIASGLTRQALNQIRKQGTAEVWLQVRSDNHTAIRLYRDLGFESFSTVVQWQLQAPGLPAYHSIAPGWKLDKRKIQDWPLQREALNQAYPKEVRWHTPVDLDAFSPWHFLNPGRIFTAFGIKHFAVHQQGRTQALLSLVTGLERRDHLFLANPKDLPEALPLLVQAAIREAGSGRLLQLEYPAGRLEGELADLGFKLIRRLDWMRLKQEKAVFSAD